MPASNRLFSLFSLVLIFWGKYQHLSCETQITVIMLTIIITDVVGDEQEPGLASLSMHVGQT